MAAMHRAKSVRSAQSDACHFAVSERYRFLKLLGSGSYGVVGSFHDSSRGRDVAIKRVRHVFDNFLVLRRTLREIRLMRHFRHPNVLRLYKVLPMEPNGGDLYLSIELMDCDLETLIHTKHVVFTDRQCRRFCSQMLLGLLHLHSGHVIHRDLKPANIFVRLNDCQVKIGDLGLSRGIAMNGLTGEATHPTAEQLTEYVVTRWYRAPEVLLARSKYGPPVDVWSVGCILYEMWARKALFPGKNSYDQLKKTIVIVGMPSSQEIQWVPRESLPLFERCCPSGGTRFEGELPQLVAAVAPAPTCTARGGRDRSDAMDVLRRMCTFDPSSRITTEEALRHQYLQGWTTSEERTLAKVVAPADVAYDCLYDGIGREGEPAAMLQLGRLLRGEVARDQPTADLPVAQVCAVQTARRPDTCRGPPLPPEVASLAAAMRSRTPTRACQASAKESVHGVSSQASQSTTCSNTTSVGPSSAGSSASSIALCPPQRSCPAWPEAMPSAAPAVPAAVPESRGEEAPAVSSNTRRSGILSSWRRRAPGKFGGGTEGAEAADHEGSAGVARARRREGGSLDWGHPVPVEAPPESEREAGRRGCSSSVGTAEVPRCEDARESVHHAQADQRSSKQTLPFSFMDDDDRPSLLRSSPPVQPAPNHLWSALPSARSGEVPAGTEVRPSRQTAEESDVAARATGSPPRQYPQQALVEEERSRAAPRPLPAFSEVWSSHKAVASEQFSPRRHAEGASGGCSLLPRPSVVAPATRALESAPWERRGHGQVSYVSSLAAISDPSERGGGILSDGHRASRWFDDVLQPCGRSGAGSARGEGRSSRNWLEELVHRSEEAKRTGGLEKGGSAPSRTPFSSKPSSGAGVRSNNHERQPRSQGHRDGIAEEPAFAHREVPVSNGISRNTARRHPQIDELETATCDDRCTQSSLMEGRNSTQCPSVSTTGTETASRGFRPPSGGEQSAEAEMRPRPRPAFSAPRLVVSAPPSAAATSRPDAGTGSISTAAPREAKASSPRRLVTAQQRFLDDLAESEQHWKRLQSRFNEALGLAGNHHSAAADRDGVAGLGRRGLQDPVLAVPSVVPAGVPWRSMSGHRRW